MIGSWSVRVRAIPIPWEKRVSYITIRLCLEDATGEVHLTDLMLQGGRLPILWSGHVSEIKFSFEQ